jgi:hypothetical protein
MTSSELLKLLAADWRPPRRGFLAEFRGGTGWSRDSRADAIGMDLWPSDGLEITGFELKISRGDWLRERRSPSKAQPIKQFCDRWYLVVSDLNIVKYADELPYGWGLMYAEQNSAGEYELKTMVEAEKLHPQPIDRAFLAALVRRATKVQAELSTS